MRYCAIKVCDALPPIDLYRQHRTDIGHPHACGSILSASRGIFLRLRRLNEFKRIREMLYLGDKSGIKILTHAGVCLIPFFAAKRCKGLPYASFNLPAFSETQVIKRKRTRLLKIIVETGRGDMKCVIENILRRLRYEIVGRGKSLLEVW